MTGNFIYDYFKLPQVQFVLHYWYVPAIAFAVFAVIAFITSRK